MGSRIPTKGPAAFQYDLMLRAAEENSEQAVLLCAEADEEKTPQRVVLVVGAPRYLVAHTSAPLGSVVTLPSSFFIISVGSWAQPNAWVFSCKPRLRRSLASAINSHRWQETRYRMERTYSFLRGHRCVPGERRGRPMKLMNRDDQSLTHLFSNTLVENIYAGCQAWCCDRNHMWM
jgi:hypothetical protein